MYLRALIVVMLLVLAGCAATQRVREAVAPVVVPASTWRQVDREIAEASQQAVIQVKVFARGSMEHWRVRVYAVTEETFIPWFSSYWTQEWMAMKVSWYSLTAGDEQDAAATRLAEYLKEQYQEQVLAPVAVEIDPDAILNQATEFYIELLDKQVQVIAQRYRLPAKQLDQRLNGIQAIRLGPPPARDASLYQVLHAKPLTTLPAYSALYQQIHSAPAGTGEVSSEAGIVSVARQASEKFEAQMAGRGIAGAASAVAGKVAGAVISLGAAGFRAIAHESDRAETEAQIRQSLGKAFDQAWFKLLNNTGNGVMAGVYYLAGHIEGELGQSAVPEPPLETVPGTVHPPATPGLSAPQTGWQPEP
ncbi:MULTISPECIES: hypothetical protein [Pseudomonas]|uniref:hypothetical protein n=1 Tax=Pseudomonas TaxID=286 RepID=UPI0006A64C03|nr:MULTISPECIES: hypothetical protein [Pseudomonas]AZD03393.1 hypothetical protein C4K27_4207 [Pseudomonas chlororaphis subsp. chlororaphis]MBM0284851.1 hypothetical protein [Pseudomonas chlororaphis]MDO1506887.1 hypothetical protein [Pseudomonas chlororaphis]ORM45955.1 hypothetical protein B6D51_22325 [Pseudomonas chlororaphis subsp. chlororaphis]PMY30639.1 hypothetical protein C1Y35_31420 [Pseudomonas sp. GW456-L14]